MEILILHGWGQNKTVWDFNRDQLGKLSPTTVIDLPGFGSEPLVSGTWGVPEYANWVQKYIEKRGMKDAILIGHSFGGRIACFIASKRPKWLKALILEGAPALYRPKASIQRQIFIYKLLKRFLPHAPRQKMYSRELRNAEKQGLGKIFRNIVIFDQTKLLPKINVPTLILWGENDQEVDIKIGQEMQTLIPNSQFMIIPHAGHQAHLDNPNLFYGYTKNFIENLK